MRKLLVMASVILVLAGCYNDNKEELYNSGTACDTAITTYAAVIKPIIDQRCATTSCHNGPLPSGYDLSTYSGVVNVVNSGQLQAAITWSGPYHMPKGESKMDDCTINKILAWVHRGAQNN